MKKLNKKGFILVETLIVTVFVVTMFIVIYQATMPILGDFEQYNKYEDIDAIYDANLYRQMIQKYGNDDYIKSQIDRNTYVDISNCNNTDVYTSGAYCNLVQEALGITSDDRILLTEYDISDFKNVAKANDDFDSGVYSNFREYLNTISNTEPFYTGTTGKIGKYRLFLIKNIKNSDNSKSRKYTNLGVYDGDNYNYVMGDEVYVNVDGSGMKKFYVLKNSNSIDSTVTLIAAENLPSSNIGFSTGTSNGTLFYRLDDLTSTWCSEQLVNYNYYSKLEDYSFNYNNIKARLLDEYDIYEFLGCKDDEKECFDADNAFALEFDNNALSFLTDNLTDDTGYWTALTVPKTNTYAWAIMKGRIQPINITDTTHIGIRPVIVVDKTKVSRGDNNG